MQCRVVLIGKSFLKKTKGKNRYCLNEKNEDCFKQGIPIKIKHKKSVD